MKLILSRFSPIAPEMITVVTGIFLLWLSVVPLYADNENVTLSLVNISGMTVTVLVQCDPTTTTGCDEYNSHVVLHWGEMGSSPATTVLSTGAYTHTFTAAGDYCLGLMCAGGEMPCGLPDTTCWSGGSCYPAASCLSVTVPAGGGDTQAPTVTIQEPTTAATYTTTTPTVVVGGQAVDDIEATQIHWSNDRGGSGTAAISSTVPSGGLTYSLWSAIGIPLQSGDNTITVTAQDAAGNNGTDVITVTYNPPDAVPPTVIITSPTAADSFSQTAADITLLGTATDNSGSVTRVEWSNDRGGSGTAVGTTSWTVSNIPVQEGTNVITVTAFDGAENSSSDTLTVTRESAATDMFVLSGVTGSTVNVVVTCDPDNPCDGYGNDLYIAWSGPPWILGNNLYGPITTASNAAPFGKLFSHTYHVGGTNCLGLVSYRGGVLTPLNNCWTGGGNSCAGGSTCSQVVIFGGDTLGPRLSVLAPVNNFSTSAPVITINGSIYDVAQNESGSTVLSIDGHRVGDGIDRVEWRCGDQSGTATLVLTDRCEGTWVANVPLNPGANQIYITGYDFAGNASSPQLLSGTSIVADVTAPVVSISAPTSAATYTTTMPVVALSGMATDNVGVSGIDWSNDRGGGGTATGTTAWSVAGISLQVGDNLLTVTARDAAGNSATDVLTVTYSPPDTTPPTVGISSPTPADTYATTALTLFLGGTASDNVAVTQVRWSNSRGGSGTATGTAAWTISALALQPGSNLITVTARDAAGNSASDTLAVECSPPAGAYSVVPLPATGNIIPDLNNVVPINYTATAPGGGDYTLSSVAGTLVGYSSGQVYGTVAEPLSLVLTGGSGLVAETLTVAPKILTAAVKNRENRIIYRRRFSDGVNSAVSEVILQVVPLSAGTFSLTRLGLNFEKSPTPGRVTVERNSPCPRVVADISYAGSGLLRGQWLVDGQILGFVTRQLLPGMEKVQLFSPEIPPFPTYDTGRHEVLFDILEPEPGFSEPTIYYDVVEGRGGGLSTLILPIEPADGATLIMGEQGPYPKFGWQDSGGNPEYHFAVYPGEAGAEQVPLITAICTAGFYRLSSFDVLRLSYNLPYRWQVTVYADGQPVSASLLRTVYFIPPDSSGEIRLRNLNITPLPPQSWLRRLLSPASAFAAEQSPAGGTTTFAVNKGDSVLMTSELVNATAVEKSNLRVEFIVDGEVVDASFVPSLSPGQVLSVEGVYDVLDSGTHALEIRVLEGEADAAELIASLSGSMVGDESGVTRGGGAAPAGAGELSIGPFTVQVAEVINDDPNNYAGSGAVEIPFLGVTLNVDFSALVIDSGWDVTSGTIRITPAQPLEYELAPAQMSLSGLTLTPGGATCQGELTIAMPFALERLRLSFDTISIHPDNGLSGTLALAANFNVDLTDLLEGFAIGINQGSTVTLGPNLDANLSGTVQLPADILETAGAAGLNFGGLTFNRDGGFSGSVQLNSSNIAGTNLGLSGGLLLDFTTTASPGVKAADAAWMGIYVDNATLKLPDNPVLGQFAVSNLYIDNGVSGDISGTLSETFTIGSGDGAFSGSLNSVELHCRNYRLTNGTFAGALSGTVAIPYLDLEVAANIGLSVAGLDLQFRLVEAKEATLAETVTLAVQAGSSVAFDAEVLRAELITSITGLGKLGGQVEGGIGATLMIASNGELGIRDANGELSYWYECPENTGVDFLDYFSLNLDKVGFGLRDQGLFFGVGGNLTIVDKLGGAAATAGINIPGGKIWTDEVAVETSIQGAFAFSGQVSLMDDDIYGNGFSGDMELSVADLFAVDSRLIAGHTGEYPYFYIDGSVEIPDPGIQLSPYPLAFYGFGGGAYFNMAPAVGTDGTLLVDETDRRIYRPQEDAFGLKAILSLGTNFDSGYTFNGTLGLDINVSAGDDSGASMSLMGDAYLLCNRTARNENRRIHAEASFGCYEASGCAFSTLAQIENFALVDPNKALAKITGDMDIKFAENDWHLYMGRRDAPATIAILPFITGDDSGIGRAQGYLEVDRLGIRSGYLVELDSGKRRLLIFYGRVWGGQQADYEVSFDPMFVYAEFSVWMGLEAGIGIDGLGDFEIISAQAALNAGVRTPNPTRIWARGELEYSFLGGLVSGDWSMTFSWGEELEIGTQDAWPCFETFAPQNEEGDVNIMSPIKVVMTTPVGKKLTYQDENGHDLDVEVRLTAFDVYCTSCVGATFDRPSIPGQIHWNNTNTAFTFEPDAFLEANQSYSIVARAAASGTILTTGSYIEERTLTFNTGDFPDTLNLMVGNSYPRNGRKYAYTGYPLKVEFSRALPLLANEDIEARLVSEGGAEVSGTYTLAADYRSLEFVPDVELAANGFYEFKLVNVLFRGADSAAGSGANDNPEPASATAAETAKSPAEDIVVSREAVALSAESLYLAELASGLGETWLSIKFETGSYSGFKAMLEASRENFNLEVTRPEVYSAADLQVLIDAPRYRVALTTVEPFYWDELDLQVEAQHTRPGGCCQLYFEPAERPDRPNQQPVDIDPDAAPSAAHYDIYSDPASGFYGADCLSTEAGLRQITRTAGESITPQLSGAAGELRQALRLDVRYGRLEVMAEETDCVFDLIRWNTELNNPYNTGGDVVSADCRRCLNRQLVDGSLVGLAHNYSNLGLDERWTAFRLDLPLLPTEPDPAEDEGGLPAVAEREFGEVMPQVVEIDDGIYPTPEQQKPVFPDDLLGPVGELLDQLPWPREGLVLMNEFNAMVGGYSDLVSAFGAMDFGADLNKQYDVLVQRYDQLLGQYTALAGQADTLKSDDLGNLVSGFRDLNASFQDLNNRFAGINGGRHIF